MTTCPKCSCDLTESDFESGRCAKCHTELAPSPTPAAPTSPPNPTFADEQQQGADDVATTDTKKSSGAQFSATVDVDESLIEELGLSDSSFDDSDIGATMEFGSDVAALESGPMQTIDPFTGDSLGDAHLQDSDDNRSGKVKIRSGSGSANDSDSKPDSSGLESEAMQTIDPFTGDSLDDIDPHASDSKRSDSKRSGKVKIRSGSGSASESDSKPDSSGLDSDAMQTIDPFTGDSLDDIDPHASDSNRSDDNRSGKVKIRSGSGSASESGSKPDSSGLDSGAMQTIDPFTGDVLDDRRPKTPSKRSGKVKIRSGSGFGSDSASTSDSDSLLTNDDNENPTHVNETMQLDSDGVPIDLTIDVDSIMKDSEGGFGATLDSDAAAMIHPTWMGALRSGVNPTVSLKSDMESGGLSAGTVEAQSKNSLHIQTRVIIGKKQAKDSKVPADYGVLKILGKGGMGVVYSAHQASLGRNVAVKMLLPDGAKNPKARNAFLSEAAVTGDLEHPNIVPIYDLGRAPDGAFFYAMKHVHGTPWNKTIRDTPLPQNLEYLLRVCDATAFAHSKGILHRDLKPENTMIGEYGEVMVMDWGLAIPSDGRRIAGIELGQCMAGTPSYMAPEMARGPFENISTRSDIFLLGAILFEIVTGNPPHTGASSRTCMLNAAHNRIRETEIKSELLDIAYKAMDTNQDLRYQTVQELQAAIREYQSHSESIALSTLAAESLAEAHETEAYEDFNRALFGFQQAIDLWIDNDTAYEGLRESKLSYAKVASDRGDYDLAAGLLDTSIPEQETVYQEVVLRRKDRERREQRSRLYRQVGVGLAGALFLVVSGAAIWINSARQEAVTQREAAVLATKEADLKRAQAIEAQESEQQQRVIAEQKQRDAELAKEQAEQQRKLAEAAKNAEKEQRLAAETARMEAERSKEAEQKQRQLAVEQRIEAEQQRAFAEDQRKEAIEAKRAQAYEAYVARIAAAASRIDENAYLSALELLRDCIPSEGETDYRNWEWGRMVYLCKQATQVLAIDHSLETIAATHSNGEINLVATAGDAGTITVWEPKTGKRKTYDVPVNKINTIAFSPDHRQLAIGTDSPGMFVQLVDLSSGRVESMSANSPREAHQQAVLGVDFSADGSRLVSASRSGKIKVWDVASRRATVTLHRHRSAVQQAKFFPSPDGQLQTKIVSVGHDGNAVVWHDKSGRWASSNSVQEKGIFREHRGPIFAVAISDDAKQIATAGHGGRILIWSDDDLQSVDLVNAIENNEEVSSVTESRRLVGHTAAVRSLDFAKSSDLLLSAGHDNTVRVWNAKSQELIKVLRGHGRWVRGCVVADDGRSVVSAGYDGAARFWDIGGYEELRVLRGKVLNGHEDGIMAAAFSGDSQQIVTASRDRTVKSWEAKSGKELRQFREGHRFLASDAVAYLNGRFLATAAGDETVRLWNVETGSEIRKMSGTGQGAAVDVSLDGRLVLTGGPAIRKKQAGKSEGTFSARLWDAQTGQQIHQLVGHRAMVSAVAISPDSRILYTGDVNGSGFLWDRMNGKLIRKLPWHQSKVIRAKFSADGQRLITASFERGVATWDVATAQVKRDLILLHPKELISVDIDRDANTVVTSSEDQKIRVWDALTRTIRQEFVVKRGSKRTRIDKVSISPDGSTVIAVDRQSGTARVFDAQTGRELTYAQSGGRKGGLIELTDGSQLSTVVFANDSNHVVSVGGDQIRMWGANPQQPQYRRLRMNFSPHGGVASASYSTDSAEIVSGSWDGTANVWNAETGAVRTKLVGRHAGPVYCATFSPDSESKLIATASADRTIVLWDSKTGDFIRRLVGHTDSVNWIAFSPDGKRLVSASDDKTARVWNLDRPDQNLVFQHDSPVLRTLFSPDGSRIASSTFGNLAFIWKATQASDQSKPVFELAGHTAPVTSVAFSPDGKRAITGSEDFTAKVWDVTERGPKELIALSGHERTVTSVAFSPDRLHVLTGSQDGTAIIWMSGPWDEIDRKNLSITENITPPNQTSSREFVRK